MDDKLFKGFLLHLWECLVGHSIKHDSIKKMVARWIGAFALPVAASFGNWWKNLVQIHLFWAWVFSAAVVVIDLLWQSYLIAVAAKKREMAQKEEFDRTQSEFDGYRNEKACLDIVFKKESPMWIESGHFGIHCKIGVKNSSRTTTAKNVQLRVVSIESQNGKQITSASLYVTNPVGQSLYSVEVPPSGAPIFFDFFKLSLEGVTQFKLEYAGNVVTIDWIKHAVSESPVSFVFELQCTGENLETKTKKAVPPKKWTLLRGSERRKVWIRKRAQGVRQDERFIRKSSGAR